MELIGGFYLVEYLMRFSQVGFILKMCWIVNCENWDLANGYWAIK